MPSEFRRELWCRKTRVTGLSCRVICVILRLAVLIQYRSVTDTHTRTHARTHTQTDRQTDTRRRRRAVKTESRQDVEPPSGFEMDRLKRSPPHPPLEIRMSPSSTAVYQVTSRFHDVSGYAKRGICRRRVSMSVTLRYCMKTAKRRITQIMPHDRPGTLVFK